jgi:bifunctional non-homologous end joining protein LigD
MPYGLLDRACHLGLEGIIAKRRDTPYRSGRARDWLKIKCVQSDSFAIVGYQASASSLGGLGRLYLAARSGGDLIYVGGVGTGFTQRTATELVARLRPLVHAKSTVKGSRLLEAVWVKPVLVAEVEFRGWTSDNKLRHASFKGLRDDADNVRIYELE